MKRVLSIFNFRKNIQLFKDMQKRPPKIFFCILLVLFSIALVETFIFPINFFSYRISNSISVKSYNDILKGPFYPNQSICATEQGDLGHHTQWAIDKNVCWETDRYGYRKKDSNRRRYDVVVVGDSVISGHGLTQEDMLSEVLEKRLDLFVYPLASGSLDNLIYDKIFQENPPRFVILGLLERTLREYIRRSEFDTSRGIKIKTKRSPKYSYPVVILDRFSKSIMKRFLRARVNEFKEGWLKEMLGWAGGQEDFSQLHRVDDILFFTGETVSVPKNDSKHVAKVIASFANYFKSKDIHFAFFALPDKENIYIDVLENQKESSFLSDVYRESERLGVATIDTPKVFKYLYDKDKRLLFHKDDTHWNSYGVKVTADLIEKYIKENMN